MPNHLSVNRSNIPAAGRGVFAKRSYQKGELIEECPVILLSKRSIPHIDKTELANYYFEWGMDYKKGAIALGLGSLYNHSFESNAEFNQDFKREVVRITAITTIPQNTEITVNYNGDPTDHTPLWRGAL